MRGPDVRRIVNGDLARPPGERAERCSGPGYPAARRLCVPCPLARFRPRRGPRDDTPSRQGKRPLTGHDAETRTCSVPRRRLQLGQPCDQGRTPGFPENTGVKLVVFAHPSSQASRGMAEAVRVTDPQGHFKTGN